MNRLIFTSAVLIGFFIASQLIPLTGVIIAGIVGGLIAVWLIEFGA